MRWMLLLGLLSFAVGAWATTDLDIVVGSQTMFPTVSANFSGAQVSATNQNNFVFGFFSTNEIGQDFIWQTGLTAITRPLEVTATMNSTSITQTDTLKSWQIPLLLGVRPSPYISFALGLAFNFANGNISASQIDPSGVNGGSASGQTMSYDQAGWAKNDTDLEFAVQGKIPVSGRYHIFWAADYQVGLTNLDNTGVIPTKINAVQVWAGFGFPL